MPDSFVLYFIARISQETDDVISPHSVKFLTHRGLPYGLKTEKISYKVYDINAVKNELDEQRDLKLRETAAFRHFVEIDDKDSISEKLSMKEKIARMKASSKIGYVERIQVPTSRSSLVISDGEGRCTREMEMIYWPKLYPFSTHYKFQLRFFIQKCDMQ